MASELIVASVATSVAKRKISEAEQKLLMQLEKAEYVDVVVPDDIAVEDFRVTLSAVCKTFVKAELKKGMLIPVLGRLMLAAKNNPELWSGKHENYEAFVASTEEEYGVSRGTLYEFRLMVERWGETVSIADFTAIGRARLKQVSYLVPKGAEKETTAKKLLKVAATGSREELEQFVLSNYHRTPAEGVGAKFVIPCNKSQEARFARFFNNAEVCAWVESDKWAEIMDCLIAECKEEWLSDGAAKMKQKTNGAAVIDAEVII
jgi:hypothetical protein